MSGVMENVYIKIIRKRVWSACRGRLGPLTTLRAGSNTRVRVTS